ncbi:MAG: hypothetical protein Q8O42_08125 [Acidobacteriota bacterium]|nr:hypothetical protein [Acidobacteriota bacterium]
MPPRYVYWTIIVDGQPTAFRSGSLEDIMPTFNRLKEKQPNAELKWFQNGQLWPSRHDAQDFMRARGERGRAKDPRQADVASGFPVRRSLGEGGSRTEKPERPWNAKPEWKTRSTFSSKSDTPRVRRDAPAGERPAWVPKSSSSPKPPSRGSWGEGEDRPAGQARSDRKPEWKPKGTFKPKEAGHASGWGEKPAFAKASTYAKAPVDRSAGQAPDRGGKPAWKPKGTFKPKEEGHRPPPYAKATGGKSARDQARSSFRPKSFTPKVDDGRTRASRVQSRNDKLEWKPKGDARPDGPNSGFAKSDPDAPKRKWVPKADYKKSLGIEAKRDDKWRPGGEHKDPKQKYKDAKKAKWTKFKANIRARSTKPRKPKDE